MKIDVFVMGLRHIHATQGGIETHVRHLANEFASRGLNVAIAVRKESDGGEREAKTKSLESAYLDSENARRYEQRQSCDKSAQQVKAQPQHSETADDRVFGTVKIIPIWSPSIVALDAILHSFFCILYAALMRPRIVHIHAIGPGLVTPIARLFGLKVVATHHGRDYRREKWGLIARAVLRLGEWMQAIFANEIICVSKSLSVALRHQYKRNYIYVPNGVRAANQSISSRVLKELCLSPNRYILTVGRVVPEKRHCDLIDAFVDAKIPNVKLVIVGSGASTHMDRLVRKAEHSPGVVLAGFRQGDELETLYANAMIFALPSSHEGLPIALLEAMAHGCEVVVSDIPPHKEMGFSKDCYHAVGNVFDLSVKIRWAALRAIQENNRYDWVMTLKHYRWPPIARRVVEILRTVDPKIGTDTAVDVRNPFAQRFLDLWNYFRWRVALLNRSKSVGSKQPEAAN